MFKLNDDLKKMLTGLAYQDAGEFLTTRDKMKLLGISPHEQDTPSSNPLKMVNRSVTHRIALISDGRGHGAPLEYAIETCSRLEGKIDLLIHGTKDIAVVTALEERIRSAGLQCQTIQLGANPVEEITQYIHNQPAIASIIAMPNDVTAKPIMDQIILGKAVSVPVPMALIDDCPSTHPTTQSAA
jgi:hypothetical protein